MHVLGQALAGFSPSTLLSVLLALSQPAAGKAVLAGRAEFAKGSRANPMSYEEAADKFRGCAEFARWQKAKAESVISIVQSLTSERDMSRLTAALSS